MKVVAEMGKFMQIYSSRRRSDHRNDNQEKQNLTLAIRPERRNKVPLPPATAGAASGGRRDRTTVLAGGDWED
jgi:hypothetical protein